MKQQSAAYDSGDYLTENIRKLNQDFYCDNQQQIDNFKFRLSHLDDDVQELASRSFNGRRPQYAE